MASDESSASRRRRRSSPAAAAETTDTVSKPSSLADLIEHERTELMQIHAMLRCLYGVLLYADDDDSPLHADVAQVVARLLDESVTRLEAVRMRVARLEAALEERAAEMSSPPYQVREPRATYSVLSGVRNSTTRVRLPPTVTMLSRGRARRLGTLAEHARLLE